MDQPGDFGAKNKDQPGSDEIQKCQVSGQYQNSEVRPRDLFFLGSFVEFDLKWGDIWWEKPVGFDSEQDGVHHD